MKSAIGSRIAQVLAVVVLTFTASAAWADEGSGPKGEAKDSGYSFGIALTIGEGMYFIDDDVWRGPVSLEIVPSFGWSWFKFDLGLSTTLESIRIAGTNVGNWNFTFRPGGRLTPPAIPVYFRFALPLQIQRDSFDYGLMFGLGADIYVGDVGRARLGIVVEVDTTLSKHLAWGGDGVPLEFRIGMSLGF